MKQARPKNKTVAVSADRLYWIAVSALVAAVLAAGVMSVRHIWAITLPGCGQLGGCEWAVAGPYSKIIGFPVAFLGLGYFVGSLLYLLLTRSGYPHRLSIWVVRIGALGSLVFIGIMLSHGQICVWCAATHVGNLIFWSISEKLARSDHRGKTADWRNTAIAVLVGGLVMVGLQITRTMTATAQEAENYRKGMESVAQMGSDSTVQEIETPVAISSATMPGPPKGPAASVPTPPRFGGRYWEGNTNASVRIVVFHDYQCQLCREVEAAIAQLMAHRSDVAFSVKQWPFDADCNRFILGTSMHPGACDAAKVAEAAGLAGGDRAFWGMHHWLVERGGQFSQSELKSQLDQLGVDADDFGQAFNGSVVDSLVRADIEEGMAFGLTFTPMVFVNGYKVEGWQSAGVLPAAIERAAEVAKRQPRRNDRPDLALDIQYRQWLAAPAVAIPLRPNEQSRGPHDATTTILVYGDLTCVFHASAYAMFDRIRQTYPGVRYIFRDFPLDATCNELVKQQINLRACEVSRWAIAVGRLARDSGYWKAHDWIVRGRDHLENVTIENLGSLVGLSPQEILRMARSPEAEGALQANLSLAIQMGVTMSPTIYVNGKIVTGWRTPGVLDRVVSSAVSGEK
jgi:protein-disulfide isomerase/uncharacterized membrane protein